jgi:hypothetical protein
MITTPVPAAETALESADRLAILDLVNAFGLCADARQWDDLEALLNTPVTADYTSLNGCRPVTISPGELVVGWRNLLGNLKATQHMIANHHIVINGDHATCAANVQATHVLPNPSGDPTWTLGGRYDFLLERTANGWRIASLTLTVQWATGNQQIMQLAAP